REGHDRALGALALSEPGAGALTLALTVGGVHGLNGDAEDLLDGDLDLRLVGARGHQERVHALLEQAVGLLGDDRGDDHVPGVGDCAHLSASFAALPARERPACVTNASRASTVNTTSSALRTS